MNNASSITRAESTYRQLTEQEMGRVHLLIILIGGVVLVLLAGFSTLWFDEAYSVAMARLSFSDIWEIGSSDVHPVLYYWLLHCVDLVLGENIYAFRLFSIIGAIILSLLGYTHIREDFGSKAGLLFSLLVFLIPWSVHIAFQIRMYEWVAVAVMIAAIYGWRIIQKLSRFRALDDTERKIPLYWWAILCFSSVAAAYLHYYGAIAAFCIQLIVLMSLLLCRINRIKNLLCWLAGAFVAVCAYLPWLAIAAQQTEEVSEGFWIPLDFPATFAELLLFPFNAPEITTYFHIEGMEVAHALLLCAIFIVVIVSEAVCICSLGKTAASSKNRLGELKSSCLFFLGIYAGMILIAGLLSAYIDQPVLYYRYLSVAIGPLVLIIALALSSLSARRVFIFCGALIIGLSIWTYVFLLSKAYDPQNQNGVTAYEQIEKEVQTQNRGEKPLVFSSDIGYASIVAEGDKDASIIFIQPLEAYKVFEPRLIIDQDWPARAEEYKGKAIFIGSEEEASSFASQFEGDLVKTEKFYHPYSDQWITYSVLNLNGSD